MTPTTRNAANTAGSQPLVANGLAFDEEGDLSVSDTARGAIWKVRLDRLGMRRIIATKRRVGILAPARPVSRRPDLPDAIPSQR